MTISRPRPTVRLLTVALGAILVVAACSSASATTNPTAAPAAAAATSAPVAAALSTTPAPAAAAGAASPTAAAYTVAVAETSAIGKFLTGEDGKTLYTLKSDSTNSTTCTGACATNWPPFTLDTGETTVAGAGVTGVLGTFTRPEGTTQVTYAGMPLYYFAGDTKAGDTTGQGIKGVWFVASPDAKAKSGGVTY
jgi:predicted lipoprotein with Yx(FWY)xxD motif